MSKKEFIALADMIRANRDSFGDNAIHYLADFCERQNPAFNRKRWLDYIDGLCGSNGGKIKPQKP